MKIQYPSNVEKIINEAVKIYFDFNCSAKEAVEMASEIYGEV